MLVFTNLAVVVVRKEDSKIACGPMTGRVMPTENDEMLKPKFDVNAVYGHALTIKHRLDPGIKAARKLQDVLKWKRPVESASSRC